MGGRRKAKGRGRQNQSRNKSHNQVVRQPSKGQSSDQHSDTDSQANAVEKEDVSCESTSNGQYEDISTQASGPQEVMNQHQLDVKDNEQEEESQIEGTSNDRSIDQGYSGAGISYQGDTVLDVLKQHKPDENYIDDQQQNHIQNQDSESHTLDGQATIKDTSNENSPPKSIIEQQCNQNIINDQQQEGPLPSLISQSLIAQIAVSSPYKRELEEYSPHRQDKRPIKHLRIEPDCDNQRERLQHEVKQEQLDDEHQEDRLPLDKEECNNKLHIQQDCQQSCSKEVKVYSDKVNLLQEDVDKQLMTVKTHEVHHNGEDKLYNDEQNPRFSDQQNQHHDAEGDEEAEVEDDKEFETEQNEQEEQNQEEQLHVKKNEKLDGMQNIQLSAKHKELDAAEQNVELSAQQIEQPEAKQNEHLDAKQDERLATELNEELVAEQNEELSAQQIEHPEAKQSEHLDFKENEHLTTKLNEELVAEQNEELSAKQIEQPEAKQNEHLDAKQNEHLATNLNEEFNSKQNEWHDEKLIGEPDAKQNEKSIDELSEELDVKVKEKHDTKLFEPVNGKENGKHDIKVNEELVTRQNELLDVKRNEKIDIKVNEELDDKQKENLYAKHHEELDSRVNNVEQNEELVRHNEELPVETSEQLCIMQTKELDTKELKKLGVELVPKLEAKQNEQLDAKQNKHYVKQIEVLIAEQIEPLDAKANDEVGAKQKEQHITRKNEQCDARQSIHLHEKQSKQCISKHIEHFNASLDEELDAKQKEEHHADENEELDQQNEKLCEKQSDKLDIKVNVEPDVSQNEESTEQNEEEDKQLIFEENEQISVQQSEELDVRQDEQLIVKQIDQLSVKQNEELEAKKNNWLDAKKIEMFDVKVNYELVTKQNEQLNVKQKEIDVHQNEKHSYKGIQDVDVQVNHAKQNEHYTDRQNEEFNVSQDGQHHVKNYEQSSVKQNEELDTEQVKKFDQKQVQDTSPKQCHGTIAMGKQEEEIDSKQNQQLDDKQNQELDDKQDQELDDKQDQELNDKQDQEFDDNQDQEFDDKQDQELDAKQDEELDVKPEVGTRQNLKVEADQNKLCSSQQINKIAFKDSEECNGKQNKVFDIKQIEKYQGGKETYQLYDRKQNEHSGIEEHVTQQQKDKHKCEPEEEIPRQDHILNHLQYCVMQNLESQNSSDINEKHKEEDPEFNELADAHENQKYKDLHKSGMESTKNCDYKQHNCCSQQGYEFAIKPNELHEGKKTKAINIKQYEEHHESKEAHQLHGGKQNEHSSIYEHFNQQQEGKLECKFEEENPQQDHVPNLIQRGIRKNFASQKSNHRDRQKQGDPELNELADTHDDQQCKDIQQSRIEFVDNCSDKQYNKSHSYKPNDQQSEVKEIDQHHTCTQDNEQKLQNNHSVDEHQFHAPGQAGKVDKEYEMKNSKQEEKQEVKQDGKEGEKKSFSKHGDHQSISKQDQNFRGNRNNQYHGKQHYPWKGYQGGYNNYGNYCDSHGYQNTRNHQKGYQQEHQRKRDQSYRCHRSWQNNQRQHQQHQAKPQGTLQSGGLNCGACEEKYNRRDRMPRKLYCSHTVCTSCAQNLLKFNVIVCPRCRIKTLRVHCADKLSINMAVMALLPEEATAKSIVTVSNNEETENLPHSTEEGAIGGLKFHSSQKHTEKSIVTVSNSELMGGQPYYDLNYSTGGSLSLSSSSERSPHSSRCLEVGVLPTAHCADCEQWVCDICGRIDHFERKGCILMPLKETLTQMKQEKENMSKTVSESLTRSLKEIRCYSDQLDVLLLCMRAAFECLGKEQEYIRKSVQEGTQMRKNLEEEVSKVPLVVNLPEALACFRTIESDCAATHQWISNESSRAINNEKLKKSSKDLLSITLRSLMTSTAENGVVSQIVACQETPSDQKFSQLTVNGGRMHLHSLSGITTLKEARALPVECFKSCLDSTSTLAFIDLFWDGNSQGRVYIRLTGNTVRGRQFLSLCTGEKGPTFRNTHFHRVWWKGQAGEHVWGGDYDHGDGSGDVELTSICGSEDGEAELGRAVPITPGVVAGRYENKNVSSIFRIYTREAKHSVEEAAFGHVEYGLPVVEKAISHNNIQDVIISDCGIIMEV